MTEITNIQPLLDNKGNLISSGYAKHMNFVYDTRLAKPSARLKEWDFYQIHFGEHYVLQLTLGHVSYAMQASATILDLATGDKRTVNKVVLGNPSVKSNMPTNPEIAHTLHYFSKDIHVQFETTDKYRHLAFTANDSKGVKAEINLMLSNVSKSKEKMVIATPFAKPRQWYLNYKENCFVANGYCRIEDVYHEVKNGFGLLDWGRGIWPYHHSWTWGNGGTVVDGKHFGFNIGWGFGNTEAATENMFFYDNKAYKLGDVEEIKVGDKYRYVDSKKRFVFDVEPIYDNYTKTKMMWVNNQCHQVFGMWRGHVVLDDKTKVKIPPFVAFCEHAQNQW